MKNILVTGGGGFIGSHLIEELMSDSAIDIIVNVDKMSNESNAKNLFYNNKILNYRQDINDKRAVEKIIKTHNITHIFHLAAESHVDRSIIDPDVFIYSNVIGTYNIVDSVKKINPSIRIIHVSTDEVYGHLLSENDQKFSENTILNPRSPYSSSKASSDLIALSYRETFDLNLTVTRCCNNYGPRQNKEKFIPVILKSLLNNKKIPVYGNGQNIREWIYVKDHVKALIEVVFNNYPEKILNIYGKVKMTNLELIDQVVNTLKRYTTNFPIDYIEFVEDRKGHDFCYSLTTNYLSKIQILKKQICFARGIDETVKFYIENLDYLSSDQY